jgi:hypothetical protein
MAVHSLKDPLLIKVKDGIETKLPEELKQPVGLIVAAGMRVLYSPTTHPQVAKVYDAVKAKQFAPNVIANGMVGLLGMISKAAPGKVPVEGAFPAMTILLCYVLDDLEQLYGLQVTPQSLKAITDIMLPKFKGAVQNSSAQPGAQNPASSPDQAAGGIAQQPVPPAPQGAM